MRNNSWPNQKNFSLLTPPKNRLRNKRVNHDSKDLPKLMDYATAGVKK